MTHERKLQLGLFINASLIILLSVIIASQFQWSTLAISTLVFVLFLTLAFVSYSYYEHWRQTLMNLTSYTQLLSEGVTNVAPLLNNTNGLIDELQIEINNLATSKAMRSGSTSKTLSALMDEWPIAVALFNQQQQLIYRNPAMLETLKLPLLIGTTAAQNGFTAHDNNGELKHPDFNQQWQMQNLWFSDEEQRIQMLTATNIGQSLRAHESVIQENLIRVFSHELRNSLTPMESMTDTLLSQETPSPQNTKLVLTRINQRSKHLLEFINQYADLSRLSHPNLRWFEFKPLIDESKTVLPIHTKVIVKGEKRCFGDATQLSMVLINLFKNAFQAAADENLELNIALYHDNGFQFIEVVDNGLGFTNLKNATTPFYTTKQEGSGIGLALSREVVHQHGGQLIIENRGKTAGAKITLKWPIH